MLFFNIASKGISANLLQTGSKRRRTKQQIEDEKQAQQLKAQQDAAKVAQYDNLQLKVQMMEQNQSNNEAAKSLLNQFINAGIVEQSEDGTFSIADESGMKRDFKPFDNN